MTELVKIDSNGYSCYKTFLVKKVPCKKQEANTDKCWQAAIFMILSYYIPSITWKIIDEIKKIQSVNSFAISDDITRVLTSTIASSKINCTYTKGIPDINFLITEIENERPILITYLSYVEQTVTHFHAVVLTAIEYRKVDDKLQIYKMECNDPWRYENDDENNCSRIWEEADAIERIKEFWSVSVTNF